ncbi:serine hydrolase [Pedobacter sp. HMF7647]|uniref:Serine hydrolase n=1 Tax=Hufsiella arboris TaxID=2695275 RepID=A0A7K1YB34_9SPHI|nr:serine hydrolase [Hufsiella arboris]MXV51786.1 serine hydrolase [Hufsiella arboris]
MLQKEIQSICLFISSFLFLFCSTACGQTHQQNEVWLQAEHQAELNTVVLNNQSGLLPLKSLEATQIASVGFGNVYQPVLDSILNKYEKVATYNGDSYRAAVNLNALFDDLKFGNTLIITLTDAVVNDQKLIDFLTEVQSRKKLAVIYFGNGQNLAKLDKITAPLIWCSLNTPQSVTIAAEAVFGGIKVNNKLQRTFSAHYASGVGFSIDKVRLKYTVPEAVGLNADDLNKIDNIAREAIAEHATPSAVVLVVKDGNVIFNKAYGSHTYESTTPTKITDIYDLASVTKVSATTPTVMQLYDENKLQLDSTLKYYLAQTRAIADKKDIKLREVMLHQAGFVPFIPFYEKLKPGDHSTDSSALYTTKVADGYFLRKNYYHDVMWPEMLHSKVLTRGKYVYSDLSMYFMKEIVEGITSEPLDQYALEHFYKPLGMQTAGFNPRTRFSKDQIVPTENDTYFRKKLLEGYVHDQGAAMVGGVSGHAGLFASANDLAILYQTYLNRGTYGGVQYFKPETIDMFTAKQSDVSRRGLGFDRWDPESTTGYPSKQATPKTYGHTGYTGTCVWVDPQYNLVYIFLSNRVYPKVTDQLSTLRIRPRIQDAIYDAIKKSTPVN